MALNELGSAGIALASVVVGYFLNDAARALDHFIYGDESDDTDQHCIPASETSRALLLDVYAVGMKHGNRATQAGMYSDAHLGEFAHDWLDAVIAEGCLPARYGHTPREPDDDIDRALTGMAKALANKV